MVIVTVCGPAEVLKSGGEKLKPLRAGRLVSEGDDDTAKIGLIPAAWS